MRERVIVSMFIHFLGEEQIYADVPTTASELDVYVASIPISIKTITVSNKNSPFWLSFGISPAESRAECSISHLLQTNLFE